MIKDYIIKVFTDAKKIYDLIWAWILALFMIATIIILIFLFLDDNPARDADKTRALVKEAIEQGNIDKADTLVNAYQNVFCNRDDISDVCNLIIDAKINNAIETGNYKRAFEDLDKEYLTDSVLYYDRYQAYYNRIYKCLDVMKSKKCSVPNMKDFINYSIEEYTIYKENGVWAKNNVVRDLYEYIK